MPICRRSRHKALPTIVGLTLSSTPLLAQPPQLPDNARTAIEAEGNSSLERLKDAFAQNKPATSQPEPGLIAQPTDDQRRRAFEGLAKRLRDPVHEQRAKSALMNGAAAMAAEQEAAVRRIGQALGLDAPDIRALGRAVAPSSSKAWVPVLFASSSMPISTLRTYASQLEKVGGIIAFRGMPGGMTKVGPMAKLSAEMLRLDPGCDGPACAMRNIQVIVDPLIFRQHQVARVPALAMVPGDPTLPYCERDDTSPVAAHLVYGDAALPGLLDEYARLGGKMEVADAQARLQNR